MAEAGTRWRKVLRAGGVAGGLALLVGAAVYAGRGVEWTALREVAVWQVGALMGLVGVNLLVTGLLFWVVTRSFDAQPTVGLWRMTGLICVSGLLNYLPMPRPGLVGRAAYLKVWHDLPLRQSLWILLVILGLAGAVLVPTGLALALLPAGWRWGAAGVVLVGLSLVVPATGRLVLRRRIVDGWAWVPLRAVDMFVAAGRLWLVFAIVGQPIGYGEAVAAGAASLLVKLAGLTPNGLGLSEWTVAGVAGWLTPVEAAEATAAALVDRAAEVLVVSVAGLGSVWGLRETLGVGESKPQAPE